MDREFNRTTIIDTVFFIMLAMYFTVPEHPVLYLVANGFTGVFCLLVLLDRMGDFTLPSAALLYGLFALMCFFSYFYSVDPQSSLTRIVSVFILFFLLCAGVNYFSQKDNLQKFIVIYVSCALLSCGYALLRENIFAGKAVGGSISNTNQVGTWLAFGVVFMVFTLLNEFRWWKLLPTAVLVIFVVLTASRSSALIMIISTAMLIALTFRVRKRSVGAALLIIAVLLLVFLYLIFNVELLYQVIGQRIEDVLLLFRTGEGDSSSEKRISLIQYGWSLFCEHPVFGRGISTFYAYSKQGVGFLAYSHNNYLELLVGVGAAGLLLYYALPVRATAYSMKLMAGDGKMSAIGALCFSLLTGVFISDFFSVNYYSKTVILIFIFIASAYSRYADVQQKGSNSSCNSIVQRV